MWPVSAEDLRLLRKSEEFDADWYISRYPDVQAVGLDPAVHYLRYGYRIGRDPGPAFSTRFHQHAFADLVGESEPLTALAKIDQPHVTPGHVLLAAQRVFATGEHQRALTLADRYLSDEDRHTLNILQANAALAQGDQSGWVRAVNGYLAHFDMEPVTLSAPGQTRFQQLATAPTAAITDGPKISVLMAVHNARASITQAVRSILTQSWQNLELLVVDDCSRDDSWAILQSLAAQDPRMHVRRLPVNVGPYVARNLALETASGNWITCHDGDDWAHPRRLELHMQEVQSAKTSCPASLTYMVRMQPDGYFDTIVNANPFSPDGVTRISSVSALYEAGFLRDKLGFWDSVRVGADSEMIARAEAVSGKPIVRFSQLGMICLSTEQGLTRDPVLGVRLSGHLSPARAAYKACWNTAHMSRRRNEMYLPFPQKTRRYQGDFGFDVPYDDILVAIGGQQT